MTTKQFKVQGRKALKKRYQNKETAWHYENFRFSNAVWAVINEREIVSINNFLKKIRPARILEIAVGPARVSRHLKYFKKAEGLDSSREMLAVAKTKVDLKKWSLKIGDAFNLKYPPAYFDLVLSFRFIRHFALKDRKAIFAQISRVLKNNGYLIFEALNKNMEKNEITLKATGAWDKSFYDQVWTLDELKKELKDAGFKIIHAIPIGNHVLLSQKKADLLNQAKMSNKNIINILKKLDTEPSQKNYQWTIVAQKL